MIRWFHQSSLYILLSLLGFCSSGWAAAPDDINANMRAWYDAYDINGNNDFTDNPTSGASIGTWVDKSGQGNNVSHPIGLRQPTLKTLATNYGVKFNGGQRLFRTGDIWAGNVDDVDIFVSTSTDVRSSSWLVSSGSTSVGNPGHRIGTHVPWGNGTTYWDRGTCCGSSRLNGNIAISIGTDTKYLWNFYASSSANNAPFTPSRRMYVMQNGNNSLSNNKSDSYTPTANAVFGIGARPNSDTEFFNGTIGETILYQRTLNTAERNIINSYLFARWQTPGTLNRDRYNGDSVAAYYYHVGGIGRDGGTVSVGTSRGLTITRVSGGNNRYLLAGLKDLTPPNGTVTSDLPATVGARAARDWYLDRTPNNGSDSSQLSFDLASMGITATAGEEFALLFRSNTSSNFTVLQQATVSGTTLSFTVASPDDGFYTIGKISADPEFTLQKTVSIDSDPVNLGNNPKSIPGGEQIYTIKLSNASSSGSNQADSIMIGDNFADDLSFFTGDLDGGGSPIEFIEGTPSCNLSFNFDNYASATDDATFYDASNMPVTTVNPDSEGYDANIRRIELNPQGSFAVNSGSGAPFCEFKYKLRLN